MYNETNDELKTLEKQSQSIMIGDMDVKDCIFVVPLDAPLPSELSANGMPTGTLYKRLSPLDNPAIDGYAFVPVSGAELLALDRAWRLLQTARRVYVLADLPAARYDVLFTQATRQIGLQKIDWARVSDAIASKQVADQRTMDKTPWIAADEAVAVERQKRSPISSSRHREDLQVPEADDEAT